MGNTNYYDSEGNFIDAYALLGVNPTASFDEITEATKKLLDLYDPNKITDAKAKEVCKTICDNASLAFEILLNGRDDYDKAYKKYKQDKKVLVIKKMGGKFTKPFRFVGKKLKNTGTLVKKHWKGTVATATAIAVVIGSGLMIKHHIDKTKLDELDSKPGTSQVNPSEKSNGFIHTSKPVAPDEMTTSTDTIYNSWKEIDSSYTEEEIRELVESTKGEETATDLDTVNSTLESIINASVIPAVTNAEVGRVVAEVKPVEVSSLLKESDPAIKAIENMESYLNGAITDFDNLETYATKALKDEILAGVLGEDVDGFNIITSTPEARIIWSRLVLGLNGIIAPLGKDYSVEVNGTIYTMNEINNGLVFENIINMATIQSKTMSK